VQQRKFCNITKDRKKQKKRLKKASVEKEKATIELTVKGETLNDTNKGNVDHVI